MPLSYHPPIFAPMNPWERNALDYNYPEDEATPRNPPSGPATHPVIYPGIYAPSGLDIMNVLTRVVMRPSPVVNLGPVDASCALVVCDIHQPDHPIIYANEPFVQLTGYTLREMLGKNCRFMQAPDGNVARASKRAGVVDVHTLRRLRDAVAANRELAVEVTNFKKGGQTFTNLLTIIPIAWGSAPAPRYYVGFIAEKP